MSQSLRVCDTRCQNFHKECARKEERLKTQWFLKNRQRLLDNLGGAKAAEKLQALRKSKRKGVDEPKAPKRSTARDAADSLEKALVLPAWRPLDKDVGLMKPIKPDVTNALYAPKIASFITKHNYLAERYKERPDDRFYYPYCSSWVVGWRLADYPAPTVSVYGVKSVIQSSFYRRNASSLQRDPDWYRQCQASDPKNFNEILTY
ncbi:protein ATP6V1FNB-like [Phymastichus coffea]|uniref:protein ATP6V1FNB-like n=1 Tax=Phymastichus coffea TaxID=108790 RepID=UPI00273C08D1|nr:protein ATP6V1FNB-like [Phymastichus coffea]